MENTTAYTGIEPGSFCDGNNDSNITLGIPFVVQYHVRYIVVGFYMITFVFGLAGNGLVIYIIGHFTSERAKSVANYYIWNLAFADITFVMSLPIFGSATLLERWPLSGVIGNVSCKMAYVCRDVTKFASAWTMVALSVDRCLASSYKTKSMRSIKSGKTVILIIWICCAVVSLHYFIYARTMNKKCSLQMSALYGRIWLAVQILVGYLLPSVFTYSSYLVLWWRMKIRGKMTRQQSNSSVARSSRTMTRTVLIVVVTFTLCQTPYHLMQVITRVPHQHKDAASLHHYIHVVVYANAVSQILVFVSSCCNPIIYGLMNYNFRRLYAATFCSTCHRSYHWFNKTASVSTNVNMDQEPNLLKQTETRPMTLIGRIGESSQPPSLESQSICTTVDCREPLNPSVSTT